MIIVRNNSLPDINIIQKDNDIIIKETNKKNTWQHMPQLMANELASKNMNKYPNCKVSFTVTQNNSTIIYKKSIYNIGKECNTSRYVLYNTASEAVVILMKEEFEYFKTIEETHNDSEFISKLIELGFLVKRGQDEKYIFTILRNQFAYNDNKLVHLTIYPTQDCNARCFYCFEQKEKKIWMNEQTADQIVDYIVNTLQEDNELIYHWFGGEPLMNEKIIDKIIMGVDKYFNGKLKYHSIIITNNSLITDELIKKFTTTWHVRKIQTTIDGYRNEHNKRKAYIDQSIDYYEQTLSNIRKILNANIFLICRYNFDKYNIDQFRFVLNDLEEFKEKDHFFIHATTLRNKLHVKNEAKNRYIYPEDYRSFYTHVLNLLFEKHFYKDVVNILPVRSRNLCLACSIGGLVINSEGKFFRCLQHNLDEDNCVGDCTIGLLHNDAYKKWFLHINKLPSTCQDCVFLPCCHGGCKHYRIENKDDALPCLREKFYIESILDLVNKYVI